MNLSRKIMLIIMVITPCAYGFGSEDLEVFKNKYASLKVVKQQSQTTQASSSTSSNRPACPGVIVVVGGVLLTYSVQFACYMANQRS